ncbi:hypothetical protein DXA68_13550 [Bacteroides stercorirosoris]|uniref:Uncharacterized protein n=1 Tax=Bacteroides stercorirosoris TaxID=871324 RepID=A0A413H329_9BACE|nr:hypothetical protein DXA68_13550 [Bacteroides stercorirosoris]
MSQGYIIGELQEGFSPANITNSDNFVNLLYYFGMLTISGKYQGRIKLAIPNLTVQEQLYTFLQSVNYPIMAITAQDCSGI